MQIPEKNKKALMFLGISAAAYMVYRILSKNETPQEAALATIDLPVQVAEEVVSQTKKITNKLVKGSDEAKERMKYLLTLRKSVGRPTKSKAGDLIWTLKKRL